MTAVREVIDSGCYILGARLAEFEAAMARSVGTVYAVGVASGTDALTLAIQAARLQPGDEVITVSHTAGPTAATILAADCGPRPAFPRHLCRISAVRAKTATPEKT